MITLVAAMSRDRVIGRGNRLPWSLPADLARFRVLTLGKPVVMGRKTFESIGRALPGRSNIVLTRDPGFTAEGTRVAHGLDAAVALAAGAAEIMVIGGAEVYRAALPRARRVQLTCIDADVEGDTFFPDLDPQVWEETCSEAGTLDERNRLPHRFITLERRG